MKCPKCGSTKISQYRCMDGPIWCGKCGLKSEKKEIYNPFLSSNQWIDADDLKPKEGQEVVYYFEHTGKSIGKYYRQELTEMGFPGHYSDCFGGNDGFLCDEKIYWYPLPEDPVTKGE